MNNDWSHHAQYGQPNGQQNFYYSNCQFIITQVGNGNAAVHPPYGGPAGAHPHQIYPSTTHSHPHANVNASNAAPPLPRKPPSGKYPAHIRSPHEPTLGGPYKGMPLKLQPRDAESVPPPWELALEWGDGAVKREQDPSSPTPTPSESEHSASPTPTTTPTPTLREESQPKRRAQAQGRGDWASPAPAGQGERNGTGKTTRAKTKKDVRTSG